MEETRARRAKDVLLGKVEAALWLHRQSTTGAKAPSSLARGGACLPLRAGPLLLMISAHPRQLGKPRAGLSLARAQGRTERRRRHLSLTRQEALVGLASMSVEDLQELLDKLNGAAGRKASE